MPSDEISVTRAAQILGLKYGQVIRRIKNAQLTARKAEGGWGWIVDLRSVEALKVQCKKQ